MNQNRQQTLPEEGRAKAARPSSRCLCPRPPLGSFTKEMRRIDRKIQEAQRGEALRPGWLAEGLRADFFGANSVASALGIRRGRDPAGDNGERGRAPRLEANLQPRPPLRMRRPRPPQVRNEGSPVGELISPRFGLFNRGGETTPPESWMSPLGVRPLADRFQSTTRRKRLSRLVTFLSDPTIPISVTFLNDLTGQFRNPQKGSTGKPLSL